MFQILPAVLETSESQSSLVSPHKELSEPSIIRKTSAQSTTRSSIFNIISNKKELDAKVNVLKSKVKQLELKNIKTLRTAENIKKKHEDLMAVRREFDCFKAEIDKLKKIEEADFENKKKTLKVIKKAQKENIMKSKDRIYQKNIESKQQILKERKDNEEYIKRREAYYIKQVKDKALNLSCDSKNSVHSRARSAFSRLETLEFNYHESLATQIKHQQSLLEKLESLAKEEERLSNQLSKERILTPSSNERHKNLTEKRPNSMIAYKPKKPLTECKHMINI